VPGKTDHLFVNPLYLWQNDTTKTVIDFIHSGYHREYPNIEPLAFTPEWSISEINRALKQLKLDRVCLTLGTFKTLFMEWNNLKNSWSKVEV